MKNQHERNTSGLRAHAQQKAQEARVRVSEAIDGLLKEEKPVNFNSVAKAAGVTKSYLYSEAALRARIEALRKKEGIARLQLVRAESLDRKRTDKGKDVLLAAREKRIKEENKRLRGREYDSLR